MTIQLSLTQFLHFKATISTKAKINYLKEQLNIMNMLFMVTIGWGYAKRYTSSQKVK